MSGYIDVENWRRRLKEDAAGRYHREIGDRILLHESDVEAALRHFSEAVRQQPNHPASHWYLVEALTQAGRTGEAAAASAAAETATPGFAVRGRCHQALRLMVDEAFASANQTLDAAAALDADSGDVAGCRILLRLLESGSPEISPTRTVPDPEIAREIAERAFNIAICRHRRNQAPPSYLINLYEWIAALDPVIAGEALGCKADLLFEKVRDHAAALTAAEAALQRAPSATAYFIRGSVLLVRGQSGWADAEKDLKQALRLDPRYFMAWSRLWSLARLQGALPKVLAEIGELTQNSADLPAWFMNEIEIHRAITLHAMGDTAAALEIFLRQDRRGVLPANQMWLAALEYAAQGLFDKAFNMLERGGDLPSPAWRLACRALVHLARGHLDDSLTEAAAAAAVAPDSVWEISILAQVHDARGAVDAADRLYRRAIELSPDMIWIQTRLRLIGVDRVVAAYQRLGFTKTLFWLQPATAATGVTAG